MKKIIASILSATLLLCGVAMAASPSDSASQNISAGGLAAVGTDGVLGGGTLYFALNGLQGTLPDGSAATLLTGDFSRLQWADEALYFVSSETTGEYDDEAIETLCRLDAAGVHAIGEPLRRAEVSDYGDMYLTTRDSYSGDREMNAPSRRASSSTPSPRTGTAMMARPATPPAMNTARACSAWIWTAAT